MASFESPTIENVPAQNEVQSTQSAYSARTAKTLLDSIDEGFCVVEMIFDEKGDPFDYRFLETNRAFEMQSGLVGAVGKTVREFSPAVEHSWPDTYGKVALSGISVRFTNYFAHTHRWYDVFAFRIGNGENPKIAILFSDITEKKHAAEHVVFLAELSSKLASISGEKEIIKIAVDSVGARFNADRCYFVECLEGENFVAASYNWLRGKSTSLEGIYSLYDFGGMEWWSQYSSGTFIVEDVETDPLTCDKLANYQAIGVRSYAVQPFHGDGKWTVVLAVTDSCPRKWTSDELKLMDDVVARVWPLVERARADIALRKNEAFLKSIVGATADCIKVLDLEGRLQWMSDNGQRLMEVCDFSILRDTYWPSTWPEGAARDSVVAAIKAAREGRVGRFQGFSPTCAGNPKWWDVIVSPILGSTGTPVQILSVSRDVTSVRQTEDALRMSRKDLEVHAQTLERRVAERTEQLQNTISELESFSYSISHDLRAPLRAMQSFASILSEEWSEKIGAEGKDYLRRIMTAAERMDRLIQDVLVLSRAGRSETVLERIELGSFVAGMMETYPQFGDAKADIEIIFPLAAVRANPAALTQCISNILGNALKFIGPEVKAKVRIWTEVTEDRTLLYIRDNGVGIPKSLQEKIFGIFYQIDAQHGGTGIGLAVVRKAAERMGGRVTVESDEGKGSTFCLDLLHGSNTG